MRLNSPRRGSDDGDTTEEHSAGRTHGTATTGRCLDKTRVRSLHSSACRQCTRAAQDTKPRQVRHHVCRNPRGTSVQTGWRTQCSPQRHANGPTSHDRADTDTETETRMAHAVQPATTRERTYKSRSRRHRHRHRDQDGARSAARNDTRPDLQVTIAPTPTPRTRTPRITSTTGTTTSRARPTT